MRVYVLAQSEKSSQGRYVPLLLLTAGGACSFTDQEMKQGICFTIYEYIPDTHTII